MTDTPQDIKPVCLVCKQDSDAIPLIRLYYQGSDLWICPQHFPLLIHQPAKLIGILPGAEHFGSAEHTHD